MKGFKKLGLVAAAATLPAAAFAMQPMNDTQMSGVTGQNGIDINLNVPSLTLNQTIYDRDGIGATSAHGMTAAAAGAIVMEGVGVNTNGNDIKIAIDAGQAAGAPVLNVNVALTGSTTIQTGSLYVANTSATAGAWATSSQITSAILTNSSITIGATNLNIQLGNVAQSLNGWNPMIALQNTSIAGGISMDVHLHDASGNTVNGSANSTLNIGSMLLIDSTASGMPGTGMSIGAVGIDITTKGLAIGVGSIGGTNGLGQYMTSVDLGNGTPIGDIAITGLKLSGTTVTIAGH